MLRSDLSFGTFYLMKWQPKTITKIVKMCAKASHPPLSAASLWTWGRCIKSFPFIRSSSSTLVLYSLMVFRFLFVVFVHCSVAYSMKNCVNEKHAFVQWAKNVCSNKTFFCLCNGMSPCVIVYLTNWCDVSFLKSFFFCLRFLFFVLSSPICMSYSFRCHRMYLILSFRSFICFSIIRYVFLVFIFVSVVFF